MDNAEKAQQELARIEKQIQQLETAAGDNAEAREKVRQLREQVQALQAQALQYLRAWRQTELARHPQRPHTLDFVQHIFTDFSEVHGDRRFGDDPAMVGGLARFHGEEVLVIGHQKGRDTQQKLYRNFGCPNPEGYRKAARLMRLADKFRRPIFTFVDTQGAYPGLGAEERGQAEAIAFCLREMATLQVPVLVAITGEGGSGGALAIAVGNRVLMLENAVYSVISPEGCAAIMWRDVSKRQEAARALRMTAPDLLQLGLVDAIVPEPPGGAHTGHAAAAALLDAALQEHFAQLRPLTPEQLVADRYRKFRAMAQFYEEMT